MIKEVLGIIKEEDARSVFEKEDDDFTPWLKDNINLLGEKIGIDIIDTQTEKSIGDFSLDIIGIDATSKKKVAIENQLDETDHTHLGQLITYASGIDAGIVIWLAKEIREEHKRALEWLNDNSDNCSFFGVEIKIIRIGDSRPAVDIDVVVTPNDWEKSIIKEAEELTPTRIKYREFYEKLAEEYAKINPEWRKRKAQPQSWLNFGGGKYGFYFGWAFRGQQRFSVELYIDTGDKNENKGYFDTLAEHKDEISKIIEGIEWERLEDSRSSRIVVYKKYKNDIKNMSEDEIKELISWGIQTMEKMRNVISPYIEKLE